MCISAWNQTGRCSRLWPVSTSRAALTLVTTGSLLVVTLPAQGAPKRATPPLGELSSGGTDQGQFELALGSVTLAAAASLGVVGGFALSTAFEKKDFCQTQFETNRCQLIPPSLDFASAGLSFALMVPLTVAGALLLRKGTRIRRDYRRFHAQAAAFSVSASRTGVGLSWTLRY